MKRTREEIARYIEGQLDGTIENPPESFGWHYGKCELRQLLDFVFGGPPASDLECLGEPLRLRNAKAGKWRA